MAKGDDLYQQHLFNRTGSKMTSAEQEVQRRHEMWEKLCEGGGPQSVGSTLVRELGIYRGQAGIWRDKAQTANLTDGESGVTVSVLHTGQSYADDLSVRAGERRLGTATKLFANCLSGIGLVDLKQIMHHVRPSGRIATDGGY